MFNFNQDNNCIYSIQKGFNEFHYFDGQYFCLYVPDSILGESHQSKLLVLIHGYSGRKNEKEGREQIKKMVAKWTSEADEKGWTVLAPHFDKKRFNNDYQRLNFSGLRADLRLNRLVECVKQVRPFICVDSFLLFGFSGGAQFVHRYAAFHPERVERAVAAAPGWFMWPDCLLSYPIGVNYDEPTELSKQRLIQLCNTHLLILVGEDDLQQGAFRSRYKGLDLKILQGDSRKERAEKWLSAMKKFAAKEEVRLQIKLRIIAKSGHQLNKRIIAAGSDYLSAGN